MREIQILEGGALTDPGGRQPKGDQEGPDRCSHQDEMAFTSASAHPRSSGPQTSQCKGHSQLSGYTKGHQDGPQPARMGQHAKSSGWRRQIGFWHVTCVEGVRS